MIPNIEAWVTAAGLSGKEGDGVRAGTAFFGLRRGELFTTFQYDPDYLALSQSFALEPDMPLRAGAYHFAGLPGAFRDSAPDRWGRRIVLKAHLARAAEEDVAPRSLDDVDYLLGVSDRTREGALRFKKAGASGFLSKGVSVPPLVELPKLLAASRDVADGAAPSHDALKELLDAGSGSLGGARPKASVLDGGRLVIAKFGHAGDGWDVMGWEQTALDLAHACGIRTPPHELVRFGGDACLLIGRFDREDGSVTGDRIPYLSGMSALGLHDGDRADYADLGEAIETLAASPRAELSELFRRVAFSIAIHNVDDHLRNHGFLHGHGGWRLSPLFDVNPDPSPETRRAIAVFGETGAGEADGLRELAGSFGIGDGQARQIVSDVLKGVGGWRGRARRNGCAESELASFAPMFEACSGRLRDAFHL